MVGSVFEAYWIVVLRQTELLEEASRRRRIRRMRMAAREERRQNRLRGSLQARAALAAVQTADRGQGRPGAAA